MAKLEHGNFSVADVDEMLRFVQIAFPDFRVRGEGRTGDGRRWVHVGSDDFYLAFDQAEHRTPATRKPYDGAVGVNHLGWVVDDAEAVRARLTAAGYRESTVGNRHPHRTRVYFLDPEGNDWEFVEYHSDSPPERNDYGLPDG
ncbi:MAG: VOC family protein [Myxococcales bacterium]|nr:VOC family protein [Myxococcales bacterium]